MVKVALPLDVVKVAVVGVGARGTNEEHAARQLLGVARTGGRVMMVAGEAGTTPTDGPAGTGVGGVAEGDPVLDDVRGGKAVTGR